MFGRIARLSVISSAILLSSFSFAAKPDCMALTGENTSLPIKEILGYMNLVVYQQSNVPALIVGIVSGKNSALISCGETAIGNGQRPAANTIWAIGSVSKVMTTTIFSQMIAEGKVSLTDPVEKYLPAGAKAPQSANRKITLLDLATHTSGLDRSADPADGDMTYQDQKSYDAKFAMDWLNKTRLQHKPGTYYNYSNFGYGLLGQSLAHAENTTYNELVKKYITQNLGMKDTTTKLTDEQKKREAKSYWMNDELIRVDWPFDFEAPSGGIYSTGQDMIKFLGYHLNLEVKNSEVANQINHATYVYQNDVLDPLGLKYNGMALGFSVEYPNQNMPLILNKSGWVSGFTTWVLIMPTEKIGIFSITNKPYLNIDSDLRTIASVVLGAKATKK